MENLFLVLIGITALFFILLILKNLLNWKKFCTLCVAVSLTWIILLILLLTNVFTDKIIIAILMGHTSLGIFYLWEKRVKKRTRLFRLPLLLTFIFIIYSLLEKFILNGILFLLALWTFFLIIYLFKNNKMAKKIIECCKRW